MVVEMKAVGRVGGCGNAGRIPGGIPRRRVRARGAADVERARGDVRCVRERDFRAAVELFTTNGGGNGAGARGWIGV